MKYKISVHYENKGVLEFYKEFEENNKAVDWISDLADHKIIIDYDIDGQIILVNMQCVTGILINQEKDNAPQERQEQRDDQL